MRGSRALMGVLWAQVSGAMLLPALVTLAVAVLGSIGVEEAMLGGAASWGAILLGLGGGVALAAGPQGAGHFIHNRPVGRLELLGAGLSLLGGALLVLTGLTALVGVYFFGSASYAPNVFAAGVLSVATGVGLGTVAASRSEGIGMGLIMAGMWSIAPSIPVAQLLEVPYAQLNTTALLVLSPLFALGVAVWAWLRYSPVATRRGLGAVVELSLLGQAALALILIATNSSS